MNVSINEIEPIIGCILYVVYIVGINWSYLKEYKRAGSGDKVEGPNS